MRISDAVEPVPHHQHGPRRCVRHAPRPIAATPTLALATHPADRRFNGPRDMVALSRSSPTCSSSCITRRSSGDHRGPVRPGRRIDRRELARQGAGGPSASPPNSNVWAELGTAWRDVMQRHEPGRTPTRKAADVRRRRPRVLGHRRDLVRLAAASDHGVPRVPDRPGPPRTLRVSRADRHVKRKVFGLNAAQLYQARCDRDALRARRATNSPHRRPAYRALAASGAVGARSARGP